MLGRVSRKEIARVAYNAVEAVHRKTSLNKLTGPLAKGRRQAAIEVEEYLQRVLELPEVPLE